MFSSCTHPGKALIVVGNMSEENAEETLDIDWKMLGVTTQSVQLFDGVTTQNVPLENGAIKIKVAGKHPIFLLVNQN